VTIGWRKYISNTARDENDKMMRLDKLLVAHRKGLGRKSCQVQQQTAESSNVRRSTTGMSREAPRTFIY